MRCGRPYKNRFRKRQMEIFRKMVEKMSMNSVIRSSFTLKTARAESR